MGLMATIRRMVDGPPAKSWGSDFIQKRLSVETEIDRLLHAREYPYADAWRIPTVAEAMGVPAIQRAVTLISSTTGMLSMEGYRKGERMSESPRLITRPDPDESPDVFYDTTAANMAKYG